MANTTGKKFGGRQKGTKNKKTQEFEKLIEGKGDPVVFLLDRMNDEELPIRERIDCAKAVAPYTNRKMPQATEVTGNDNGPLVISISSDDKSL